MKKKKITYFFIAGRKNRIERNDNSFAKEFFYGYFHFKNLYKNVEVIEFKDNRSLLYPFYKLLNKLTSLPIYGDYLVNNRNYKILKSTQNAIFTNQNTAFSALPLIVFSKLFHKVKSHIFIMGLFGKKMNYKIKDIFRNLFINLLIYFSENLIFLGQGELDLAKTKFPKYAEKFKFIPFSVDVNFWTEKSIVNNSPQILFIGNDGMRDYEFLHKLTLKMEDINFHIVSKNVDIFKFGPNTIIHNGSWRSEELDDSFIRKLYHNSSLTILPIKETFQPSGQSVALQSMSCGTPVLITKTEGFWDNSNFINGKNIFFQKNNNLIDWESMIRKILKEKNVLNQVSKNSRELVVSSYNLDTFNSKLEKLIN